MSMKKATVIFYTVKEVIKIFAFQRKQKTDIGLVISYDDSDPDTEEIIEILENIKKKLGEYPAKLFLEYNDNFLYFLETNEIIIPVPLNKNNYKKLLKTANKPKEVEYFTEIEINLKAILESFNVNEYLEIIGENIKESYNLNNFEINAIKTIAKGEAALIYSYINFNDLLRLAKKRRRDKLKVSDEFIEIEE